MTMEEVTQPTDWSVTETSSNFNVTGNPYQGEWANTTYGHFPLVKQEVPIIVVYTFFYTISFLCALIGNTVVVLVVIKNPRMRNVTNFFIANLAIADLIVAIVCIPMTLLTNIFNGWPYGAFLCKMAPYLQCVSVAASVQTLSAIAVDRFLAICLHPNRRITKQTSRIVIAAIWVVALILPVPWAVFYQMYPFEDSGQLMCHQLWPDYDSQRFYYFAVIFLFMYVIPLAVVLVCYVFIARRVWTRHAPGVPHDNCLLRKSRIKVVKMLAVMVILFALSWLPIHVIYMSLYFGDIDIYDANLHNIYIPVSHWLELSNSGMNPFIYCFFSRNFRRGFKALLHCSSSCGERTPPAVHSSTTKYMTIEYFNGHVTITFKKYKEESSSTA